MEIIGNLTSNAEVKDAAGKKAINFAVAVNLGYNDATGNKVEKTFYYNCTIWRDSNVRVAEYLTKGTLVRAMGFPESEMYKDKKGEMKSAIKLTVNDIQLLGGGIRREEQPKPAQGKSKFDDDDLPF
jgi:single-strand DNA-binding protein